MPNTLSPNMSLILPTVGQEPGPNWALDLNNSLSTVDQHDHSSGSGVPITPAGMNINTDLSFGNNNALNLRSVRMNSQVAPLALGADINCIYVANGNLFFNDSVGNQVQITTGGAVAGTPGSIGNLIAPAAVTYVPGTQTFVFESNQTNATPGSIDCGPLYLRNISPSSNYVLIQPNAILPASYSLTLPSALPASSKMMRLDNLGNISATLDVDNVTLEIVANVLRVVNNAITPIGSVTMFAGSVAPTGWLLCDGSVVAQATYSNLFAVIGSTFNTGGEGAGNFRLPDFRRRVAVGAGGTGSATLGNAVGDSGGAENVTLSTNEIPSHTHTFYMSGAAYVGATNAAAANGGVAGVPNVGALITPNSTGGGQAHNNMQPSLVVNYIIKT